LRIQLYGYLKLRGLSVIKSVGYKKLLSVPRTIFGLARLFSRNRTSKVTVLEVETRLKNERTCEWRRGEDFDRLKVSGSEAKTGLRGGRTHVDSGAWSGVATRAKGPLKGAIIRLLRVRPERA